MIDLDTARQLLDFSTRMGRGQRSEEQLEGAVAIHNLLEANRVAYLADEVGMGKTYVALGALALFRHFKPGFRALIIAPRTNIQLKWMKEQRNFVEHNYLLTDMRVKGFDGKPAQPMVYCDNLIDLVREAVLDDGRDFYTRMSSFSIALGGRGGYTPEDTKKQRAALLQNIPWAEDSLFDLRTKDAFKANFAHAICCFIPHFDLVIVDEGHNLKHGLANGSAARNWGLARALGAVKETIDARLAEDYGHRVGRLLLLSATPVEGNYASLYNQLNVFGLAKGFDLLQHREAEEAQQKEVTSRILIRRVTTITAAGQSLTKNQYRREWRAGGVQTYNEPIHVTDPRQRLAVALVQKKVSEILASDRFNASFQIGMLASFESFMETAKVKEAAMAAAAAGADAVDKAEGQARFDNVTQTEDQLERDGVDVQDVNRIAKSFRRRFHVELPHPKMDALVQSLQGAWKTGDKALVFVRRVASVKELRRKLNETYDKWLIERLQKELPENVKPRLTKLIEQYGEAKQKMLEANADAAATNTNGRNAPTDADYGSSDTFFAWFFRGEGPPRVVSGATIQRRFTRRSGPLATFFEDNYVAYVLGCDPAEAEAKLAAAMGQTPEALRETLREGSGVFLPIVKRLSRAQRAEAVQAAAIQRLKDRPGDHQRLARIVWQEWFEGTENADKKVAEAPAIDGLLAMRTFFTELPKRPELRAALWPELVVMDLRQAFRERELRRQLLASAARLGHSLIDFYIMTIQRLESMDARAKEGADDDSPDAEESTTQIDQYLDLLERQRTVLVAQRDWAAYDELAEIGRHFQLICDNNMAEARDWKLREVGRQLGNLLGSQQPTGGMSGAVLPTLVRQFRMPGYPFVLITTDLLQEGEDLHTFCSAIHHYGISWTSSSMEQRIGRIDRVRSQTDRRLGGLPVLPTGGEKLQVFFPHLQDTVEVLQVNRVLGRMDTFMRLMHEGFVTTQREESRINLNTEFERTKQVEQPSERLKTAFPIKPQHTQGENKSAVVAATCVAIAQWEARFNRLRNVAVPGIPIVWEAEAPAGSMLGTAKLPGGRVQPFALILNSHSHHVRLRCVSPVGRVRPRDSKDEFAQSFRPQWPTVRRQLLEGTYEPLCGSPEVHPQSG